jgi:hypothetical protein
MSFTHLKAKLSARPALLGAVLCAGMLFGCSTSNSSDPAKYSSVPLPSKQLAQLGVDGKFSGTTSALIANYDAACLLEIKKRWYKLIDEAKPTLKPNKRGKVVLEFRLFSDGRVWDMKVVEHVDARSELFCLKAVLDCSPFPKWSEELTKELGANNRKVRFTFYYN